MNGTDLNTAIKNAVAALPDDATDDDKSNAASQALIDYLKSNVTINLSTGKIE